MDAAAARRLAAAGRPAGTRTRQITREVQAWQWRDGELIAHETRPLLETIDTRDEIISMLAAAGFADVTVVGGYHGGPPTGDEEFLVYVARTD